MKDERTKLGRVRVCYLDQTAQLGGAEIALINLLSNVDRSRWEPSVALGQDGPLVGCLRRNGVQVDVMPLPPILSRSSQGSLSKTVLVGPRRWIAGFVYSIR